MRHFSGIANLLSDAFELNSALGGSSFIVLRHGISPNSAEVSKAANGLRQESKEGLGLRILSWQMS